MASYIKKIESLTLERLPVSPNQSLQAWDAADLLLIDHLETLLSTKAIDSNILVVNDSFGALSCSLSEYKITNWSDSFLSQKATKNNLKKNNLKDNINYIQSTSIPESVDIVLIKLPKTLAFLEHQLISIKPLLKTDTTIICAGMTKYIQRSHFQLFERHIGHVTTSLAKKKARLLFVKNTQPTKNMVLHLPSSYYDKELNITLINQANVFSRERLDNGARIMINHFDQLPAATNILDLACGNGVIGIMASKHIQHQHNSSTQLYFIDESYMAVASAQKNCEAILGQKAEYQCIAEDGLNNISLDNLDLILCNPPFHQNHTISDQVAWEMLKGSWNTLIAGGELWMVGNRHIGYHTKLKKIFGNYNQVATNKQFVVLSAKK